MLTEIEWWGGLLFIWGAISYRMSVSELTESPMIDKLVMHFSFAACGLLLAAYFYTLAGPLLPMLYLGILVVAVLGLAFLLFWPTNETSEQETVIEGPEEGEEELSPAMEMAGTVILFLPFVAACVLAGFKSLEIARSMQWLG
ncbi:MAG: hypothetical protein ACK4VV_02200 [Pseudomonas sp.]